MCFATPGPIRAAEESNVKALVEKFNVKTDRRAVIRAALATAVPRVALNRHVCRFKERFGDRSTDSVRGRHSPLITCTKERSLN
jgi:hypothetical protein